MDLKKIVCVLLGLLVLVVLLQNTQVISFQLLFWELRMSRIILFLIILIIGFTLGLMAGRKTRGR